MSKNHFEVIVIGLGAAGSAALYHLARRGTRVLGIDQYRPPHMQGSTHGDTRITRQAIGEGMEFVPFALRSYELFRELEAATGQSLLDARGGLIIADADSGRSFHGGSFFLRTLAAARKFDIQHELFETDQLRARFPMFAVGRDQMGYFEHQAGFLRPEACVEAHLKLAEQLGATLKLGREVTGVEVGKQVRVRCLDESVTAERVIVAAGAWLPRFLGKELAAHFTVRRQTQFWFDLDGHQSAWCDPAMPVWIWELPDRPEVIYGFPAIDGAAGGVKMAAEQFERHTTPGKVKREVSSAEARACHRNLVKGRLLGLSQRVVRAVSCLYTLTPDFGFVIDWHPAHNNVLIASPCSGHGFKHSAAVGEALADMVTERALSVDVRPFGFGRFSRAGR